MKGKYGKIRYSVEANLRTGWDFDLYAKTSFTVIRFEDLSLRRDLMDPISLVNEERFCCWSCKTKPLSLKASIPFKGFVPGQCIRVTINIDNKCGFDVTKTIISLKKVFTFISESPERREWSDAKTLLKNVLGGAKSGQETKILGIIEVPAFTLPTNDDISNIVKVSYIVQVSVDIVGFVRSVKVKLPIVIGSKPLKFENKIRY